MSDFKIKQIRVGGFDDNFSYIICHEKSGDTVVLDPCGDTSLIISELAKIKKIAPKAILLTHGHFDHVSGVENLLMNFKAPISAHPAFPFQHEIKLKDKEKIPLGNAFIEAIYAPGHTDDGIIYRLSDDSAIFTGDTLFIGCIGYCEAEKMFTSLTKIKQIADTNIVYSGHNYGRVPFRTLGEEKKLNPYLASNSLKEFNEILSQQD
jgi:glyoxylase-like metal-dependent hydrolase (beta-lactamase superfamily II)